MKSGAKLLVRNTDNTKIVRVRNTAEGEPNQCWANAMRHSELTGSTVYCGWLVGDARQSLQPTKKAICVRHYWNRLNGTWVDTTPMSFNDFTYVVKRDPQNSGWIAEHNELEHITYI